MRGEFHAWVRYMTAPSIQPVAKTATKEPAKEQTRATAKGTA